MKNQNPKGTQSIRIPLSYYRALKDKARNNRRPLVAELTIILDDYLSAAAEPDKSKKLKAFSKVRGIIKNLPRENYSQTIDKVLYGD